MYDAASLSDAPVLQRARGELRVGVRVRDARTVLEGLRQAGCLKARFPRSDDWLNVVTLNTSGGIAGGDELDSLFTIGTGARATIAAQAAERFYRALPGTSPSRVRTRVVVADGAAAEWLPQETILFDHCAVDRALRIDVADDAWFLGVESLVFGRAAMGEVVDRGFLRDRFEVWRGGRPLLHDAIRLEGQVAETLRRPAVANGAWAMATLVHVAPDVDAKVAAVRAASTGASAWDGMLVARILAQNDASLRRSVVKVLDVLRGGRALPRVWMC
ncbi:MAG TPA: urease accessory protein UreD [Acetobacteraceae bacterium]|jgi:urease accessory protein|nr:urease accessory protein UreD [Acetobacteraceae bacterium]